MENGTPKTFLTAEEAATYLGIAKITLYTYTSKRIIPYYKSRRKIYIKISDLDEFILNEANRIMPASEIESQAELYDRTESTKKCKAGDIK